MWNDILEGLLATMELKSRHDLISRMYNLIVPCRDEISFEVYMNDDAMDHVIFAVAKKKAAKGMQKEVRDLQRFAGLLSPPGGRKWVADELAVISESKEVAGDLITEAVLDQVGLCLFFLVLKEFTSFQFSIYHVQLWLLDCLIEGSKLLRFFWLSIGFHNLYISFIFLRAKGFWKKSIIN